MRLQGKKALVTGTGSGIGRSTALLFATEGAKVAAADLCQAEAEGMVEEAISVPGGYQDQNFVIGHG